MAANPINVAFGRAVALRRDELNLTQAALARRVGISRASIANIEKGRQNVLLHHVYDLAEALKMPKPGDLLPARAKPSVTPAFAVHGTDDISPRAAAQVSELAALMLATETSKARS
jgi:transcriptional regulator with XRE-family HTH domain